MAHGVFPAGLLQETKALRVRTAQVPNQTSHASAMTRTQRGSLMAGVVGATLRGLENGRARDPTLDEAVDKRDLSTGESRELVSENLGSGLNPGG